MSQAPPQWSPDGRWWWDGQRWVPAQPPQPAGPPPQNSGPPAQHPGPPAQQHGAPYPGSPGGPVRPHRSVGPWIAVGAIALVLVLGLTIGGVVFFRSLPRDSERSATAPTASAERPSATPTPTPTGPGPVRCRPDRGTGCFPKISMAKLVAALRAKGFACEKSGKYGTRCAKRVGDNDQHSYSLRRNLSDADQLESFLALGSAAAVGNDPPDRTGQANRRTVEALQAGLGYVLPGSESTRQKIAAWAQKTQGRCRDTLDVHQEIDGFQLRCSNPDAIAIAGKNGTVTTWSGSVSIGAGFLR
ncbi:hypothetical protein [Microlunatus speluncae]|uniref:hypothetical protein n=1 Tax=Microlunatus speluncae TaxID=2594267 RepID=UPI0012665CBA|nr:hypothetical protein [Microlunatus speluncae]